MDTCAGTSAITGSYLHLPEYCLYVRCERYSASSQDDLSSLVDLYAKLALRVDSITTGKEEVDKSCKMFVKEIAALESRRPVDSWTLQPRRDPAQNFRVHM